MREGTTNGVVLLEVIILLKHTKFMKNLFFFVYFVYFIRSFFIVFKNTWNLLETTFGLFDLPRLRKVEQNETAW